MNEKKFWISLIAGILAVAMLLTLVLSVLPAFAGAAESSSAIKEQINQMEKEQAQTKEEMAALKEQLDDLYGRQDLNRQEITVLLQEKDLIDQQVGLLHSQIANTNEQIAAYNVLIADKQEELEKAQIRLEELNKKYKERIRAMEEDGYMTYWSVLFEAHSFMDLLDRLNIVEEIAEADNKRLEELRTAAAAVETAKGELLAERDALEQVKKELAATQEEYKRKGEDAEKLLGELTVVLKELEADEEAYRETMKEFEGEAQRQDKLMAELKEKYDDAVYQEYLATMTTAPGPTGANGGDIKKAGTSLVDESGKVWLVPCDYMWVSSGWGYRTHPVTGQINSWHPGVDLATPCYMRKDGSTDSPIIASRAGYVTYSGWDSIGGWEVIIDHLDGYQTRYLHMCTRPFVSAGQTVAAGEVLGCIGSTGRSTGNHLHFGVYKWNDSVQWWSDVNPMLYIS